MENDPWIKFRKMSDAELKSLVVSGTPSARNLAEIEIRRRSEAPRDLRAWIAIAISAVALTVSILVAIFK